MVKQLLSRIGLQRLQEPVVPYSEPVRLPAPPSLGHELLHFLPYGTTGTTIYAGYLHEEYLQKLRSRERADEFDKMRRSDSQIISLLSAVKNPIRSANWSIEPGEEGDEYEKDAEFIDHVLFHDMEEPWYKVRDEILTVCEFGYAVFEPVHSVVLNNKKFGTYNGIRTMGFRSQRTIERWNLDEITKKLATVTQYAYGDLDVMVDIPADRLVLFSIGQEGQNYEGVSMIRPCYGNYFRKNEYLKLNASGIEKFAVPTPLVELPDGKTQESFSAMKEALEAYTHSRGNYLMYPNGYKVELHSNTYDPQKVEVSIENEDQRMARAFLAHFLNLGQGGGGGSYALGTDQSDFFLSGLEHVAEMIVEKFNRRIIPDLIKMNRGERDNYPKMCVSGITDKAGEEFARIMSMLAEKKILTPDDRLEEHVRKRYKLPDMSMDGQRDVGGASGFGQPNPQENPMQKPNLIGKIKAAERRRLGIK